MKMKARPLAICLAALLITGCASANSAVPEDPPAASPTAESLPDPVEDADDPLTDDPFDDSQDSGYEDGSSSDEGSEDPGYQDDSLPYEGSEYDGPCMPIDTIQRLTGFTAEHADQDSVYGTITACLYRSGMSIVRYDKSSNKLDQLRSWASTNSVFSDAPDFGPGAFINQSSSIEGLEGLESCAYAFETDDGKYVYEVRSLQGQPANAICSAIRPLAEKVLQEQPLRQ